MSLLAGAAGALAGAIVGSYIATLVLRWPASEQATRGRSRCDSCRRPLAPYELVPIASALVLRGRCRTCSAAIRSEHLRVEILAALLAAAALVIQPGQQGAALALFWLMLLGPALLDARHFWLPDRLTFAVAAAGVLLGGWATHVPLPDRLIGGVAGFLSLAAIGLLYRGARKREGLGEGDPKLLGAIGLWTGWTALPGILLVASLAGLALAASQRRALSDRLPFGTLLAIGAIFWTGAAAIASR